MKCVKAVCVGRTVDIKQPQRFRKAVGRVMQIEAALKRSQKRLLLERIKHVYEREAQSLQKAHEHRMVVQTSEHARAQLRQRHQQRRHEMLERVRETERLMHEMVDAKSGDFCVPVCSVPGHLAPNTGAAALLMQKFSAECDAVTVSIQHHNEQARKVRVGLTEMRSHAQPAHGHGSRA